MKPHTTQRKRWCGLLLSLVTVFIGQFALADTEVGGNITDDTTWTKANSPYIVTSTVQVLEGVKLTIEPGVTVEFIDTGDIGTNENIRINVGGELNAIGTESNKITFTGFYWGGIQFVGSQSSATFDENGNYQDGNILKYCIIQNAGGVRAVEILNSSPFITNCIISDNYGRAIHIGHPNTRISSNTISNSDFGIWIQSNSAVISNNSITHNVASGLYLNGGFLTIKNNEVIENGGTGIYLSDRANSSVVTFNIIDNNESGIEVVANDVEITYNTIISNTSSGVKNHYSPSLKFNYNNVYNNSTYDFMNVSAYISGNIEAENNYWGTTDTSLIDDKIYDYYDDIEKGEVIYEPIATQAFKTVDFSASPRSGSYPLEVTFSNNSIGVINSVLWDFGDGETSTFLNPTHTYDTLGTFSVSLTVTNPDGTITESKMDYITVSNEPPTANSGPNQEVDEGEMVSLDGSNSTDPDDGIASYLWEQTQGTPVTLSDTNAMQPTFTAPDVGPNGESLTFHLTVTDTGGLQDTDTCIVNVVWVNIPPTADAGSDQTVDEAVTVTLNSSNSSDPDDGIVSYQWTQTAGFSVTLSDSTATQPTFIAPNVSTDGESLTFQLTVTDTGGLQDTDTCIVNVTWENDPPMADAGLDQTVDEGDTVTLDGSTSTDPDDGISSYLWTQTAGTPVTLSDPSAAKPTFVTPSVDLNGITLTFQLTITDNGGLQGSDEVSVTIDDNGITGFPDNVVTMTSFTGEPIGVKEDSGGNCVSLSAVDPSTIANTTNSPENLIYGLVDMQIKTDTVGGTVTFTFYLPYPAPDGYRWYKYGPNKGWYDYSDHAVFNDARDQVALTLTDGGPGDDDGVANGVIIDPSGLGSAPATPEPTPTPTPTPTGGGGGGGGCFIAVIDGD